MTDASRSRHLGPAQGERVARAGRAVVFSGAGLSAASGLGTFRGADGLWEKFRPEDLATPEAFRRDPDLVWRWYAARYEGMLAAEPNPGHRAIARCSELFPSFLVVTQNIDGLHQRAGSSQVVELHGSIHQTKCAECGGRRPMSEALARGGSPPRCDCGGPIRPDVVWFGEMLPFDALGLAKRASAAADLFLVVGTSALVWPAAGLIEVAAHSGALVIEVNPEATPLSELADVVVRGKAEVVLPELAAEIARWRQARA